MSRLLEDYVFVDAYARYLSRYRYGENFWRWALQSATSRRMLSRQEIKNQIGLAATFILPQVEEQLLFWKIDPENFPHPVAWGRKFIGRSREHAAQLKAKGRGLYGVTIVYEILREESMLLWEAWAESVDRSNDPPSVWPANKEHLFARTEIQMNRPWLAGVTEEQKILWSMDPAVRAAEYLVVGWQGKVVATAARNLRLSR